MCSDLLHIILICAEKSCTKYIYVQQQWTYMDDRVKSLLLRYNPWWRENGQPPVLPTFERDLLNEVMKDMGRRQVISITGLRRVGKTILLKQMMRKLKTQGHNICYISFDDLGFQKYETAYELVNFFLDLSDKKGKRYLFLDEIQKLPNWADLVKVLYDMEQRLKIVISGSASLHIRAQKETLAGRMLTFNLPLVTFGEYVRYHGLDPGVPNVLFPRWYELKFAENGGRYQTLFRKWLTGGAFPELLDNDDPMFARRYIMESVIEKAILDTAVLSREDPVIINELLRLIAGSNAQVFEISNLASILRVDRNRVSGYMDLLEKSFLVRTARNHTASIAKQARTSKKGYVVHSSIVMALLDWEPGVLDTEVAGHLIEAAVANHLDARRFWRSPQRHEVDIVVEGKPPMPIEVKYKSHIQADDLRTLLQFCERFKARKAVLITKDQLHKKSIKDIEVRYIPAWMFLLYGRAML